jgi:hypothetical protein
VTTALNTDCKFCFIYIGEALRDKITVMLVKLGPRLAAWSKELFATLDTDSKHKVETAHFACCQNFLVLINTINNIGSNGGNNCDNTVRSNDRHPPEIVECLIEFLVNWFRVCNEATSRQVDMMGKDLPLQQIVK